MKDIEGAHYCYREENAFRQVNLKTVTIPIKENEQFIRGGKHTMTTTIPLY